MRRMRQYPVRVWIIGLAIVIGCAGRTAQPIKPVSTSGGPTTVTIGTYASDPPLLAAVRPVGTVVPPTAGLAIRSRCTAPGAEPTVTILQSGSDNDTHDVTFDVGKSMSSSACVTWAGFPGRTRPPTTPPPEPAPGHVRTAREAVRIATGSPPSPSPLVREQMAARGLWEVPVRVRLCIGVDGVVDEAMMVPTGFPAFDLDLLNTVGTWRYQPFTVDGVPAPVCNIVLFNIKLALPAPRPLTEAP